MTAKWMSLAILGWTLSVSPAFGTVAAPPAEPAAECGTERAVIPWKWCIYRTPGSRSSDVLWYLHGRGGNELSWVGKSEYGQIRQAWAQAAVDAPVVINVTFGGEWLLVGKNPRKRSGLLEYFEDTVIPTMEARIGGLKGRRLLLGESMGGFSAAELLLSHDVKWDKVALACPALAWLSPWAGWRKILAWTWKNKVNPIITLSILATVRPYFDKKNRDWETMSPMSLAASRIDATTPPLLLTIGKRDNYGFYSGAHDFYEIAAKQSGRPVEWHPVKGIHCSMDPESLAKFLSR